MKQNIREFIKNLISKRENSTKKQQDNETIVSLFDKNSTFDYAEPFNAPTEEEIKTIKEKLYNSTLEYMGTQPESNSVYDIVYDLKNKNNIGIFYPYDEYDSDASNLQGYRNKNFFICRSKNLFKELEQELQQNPNCSYATHAIFYCVIGVCCIRTIWVLL